MESKTNNDCEIEEPN